MKTATVTEIFPSLEPVTRDDFADSLPLRQRAASPTQRDLVVLSLVRCPEVSAERTRP